MLLRSLARIVLAAAVTAVTSSSALAAPLFSITITPNPVTGSVGQTVDIDFSLVNGSTSSVVLLDLTANHPASVFFDGSSFSGFFTYLSAGASVNGRLGTLRFDGGIPTTGTVDLDFNFIYVPDDLTEDDLLALDPQEYDADSDLASFRFQTTQAPAVPEPTSLALLGLGIAGAVATRRRARCA